MNARRTRTVRDGNAHTDDWTGNAASALADADPRPYSVLTPRALMTDAERRRNGV